MFIPEIASLELLETVVKSPITELETTPSNPACVEVIFIPSTLPETVANFTILLFSKFRESTVTILIPSIESDAEEKFDNVFPDILAL